MRATLPLWALEQEQAEERWPLVVNAPDEAMEDRDVTVFRAMAIWIGLELAVVGAVISVI